MEGDGAAAAESAREDRAEKLQKTEPEPEPAEYSDEDRARSDAIKADANAAFSASNFAKAIELYTEAIAVVPSAALHSNRAFCHIKTESMGSAILDADEAIKLDKRFAKAYYRKGTALFSMGKYKQAKKQFLNVCKLQPKNKDAAKKAKEVEKIIKELAFQAAIGVDDKSAFDELDPESITVEGSYDGPHLPTPLTAEAIEEMKEKFKDGKKLHRKYLVALLIRAKEVLTEKASMVDLSVPEGAHLTVCGDTHGQFFDLCNIFTLNGAPAADNPYLFNGDFVDRGSWSVEVLVTLLAYMVLDPTSCHLNRGNHETLNMNRVYGFTGEVAAKFTGNKTMGLFTEVFCALPLAHCIGGKVLVVHGGLFSKDGVKLQDLRTIDRFREPPDEGLMSEMLWSDPQRMNGRGPSKRGVGVAFGPDVAARFLDDNGLELLVRSHEVKDEGYEIEPGGRVVTVFSAPNYCDQFGNKGCYAVFDHTCKPKYNSFAHVPHPKVPPMAYASPMMTG